MPSLISQLEMPLSWTVVVSGGTPQPSAGPQLSRGSALDRWMVSFTGCAWVDHREAIGPDRILASATESP
jgi:hypothetical protein